jgi:hypothetical protein
MDILDASPSPGAWRHSPMTVAEIDAHPDRDRIWATVNAIRDKIGAIVDEGVADALENDSDAFERGENVGAGRVRAAVGRAVDRYVGEISQQAKRAILAGAANA